MSNRPDISVITIFFNEEEFIEEAVNSVFTQTYQDWELLLVDDGSTDQSTVIARRFAEQYPEKVRYLEHAGHTNRGMSASRNLGMRQAHGKYIALLDADDVWLPEKLARQVAIMEAQPEVSMVYGRTEYWYSWTGRPEDMDRDQVPDVGVQLDTRFEPPALLTQLYPLGKGTAPCLCSLLIKAEVMKGIGGFEEAFTGFYEDQAFLTKMYLSEPIFVSSGCWDRYRIHPASCSATVKQTGQYHSFRERFLQWLKTYLQSRTVTDSAVWRVLTEALAPYEQSPVSGEPKYNWLRLLRVAEGNEAHLVVPLDNQDLVRIAIAKAETKISYDVQVSLPRLRIEANEGYIVSFNARADGPRSIGCGFAKGHAPWTNLGWYKTMDLTSEWQSFEENFIATEDESNARIHFDVGESDIAVEVSSVTLRSLADGTFIFPQVPDGQLAQFARNQALAEPAIPFGEVQFGSLRRLTPISRDFGCDRGRPVDRYYIDKFLAAHSEDIRGRVLEIGENSYTRRFGGDRVTKSDILHVVEGDPEATIIADLTDAEHIPSDTFDCFILTQTLQLIYDLRAAISTIYRILKPGGVLLATFPGISQTYDNEWGGTWCWNFTTVSARRLFQEQFPPENLTIETFGNVLAAISFLHGVAAQELTKEELDYRDPGYDVSITVRAVKPETRETPSGRNNLRLVSGQNRNSSDHKALILMYHRVAECGGDPWSLCVSPERFAQHLEVLRKHTYPMCLQEFVANFANDNIPQRTVVVTFDDGYADNLANAKPLLEHYDIPATVFLTTGYLGENREFWWDEIERLLLQPGTLPKILKLNIIGTSYEWDLGDAAYYREEHWQRDRFWKAEKVAPSRRHALYTVLWRLLQQLRESERQDVLNQLRTWAYATAAARPTHRPLSLEEVVALGDGELVEIGAHTVTHPILSDLSLELQYEEVQKSKSRVEEILGCPVRSFAYPYGAYKSALVSLVKEAGFSCACSTLSSVVRRHTDRFQLPRVEVQDWSGETFHRRLWQWFANYS
jgi:glycosyltransferase involved in cell wall biosynthesis/peptidoglycan/xylan/chitin deacetylase (PgdA/CDA1 family)